MSTENSDDPKLIIDEDWKSQVQREKELLKKAKDHSADAPKPELTSHDSDEVKREGDSENEDQAPPPATFEFLISGMATQAFAAMGLLPGEDGKPMPTRLDYARHYIDLLAVIETKTAGNLTDSEQNLLKNTLHQLRMMFVSIKK